MSDGRALRVTVDLGAIALAVLLATAMAVTAWNWNSARHDCTQLLQRRPTAEREVNPRDVRQCASTLLGK